MIKKILALMTAFAVAFTCIPGLAGNLDVHAASLAKISGLKATSVTEDTVIIKWNRPSKKKLKKISGYMIYRNSKYIDEVGKKAVSYKDEFVRGSKTYKYAIKPFYKYKQYYNSKTKKWVNKKPAKKNWKKKKTRIKYKYGSMSKAIKVTTPEATEEPSEDESDSDVPVTEEINDDPGIEDLRPVTDFLGVTRKIAVRPRDGKVWEYEEEYDQWGILDQPLARYDRYTDGEFYYSSNMGGRSGNMVQIDGITYYKDKLLNSGTVVGYNFDPDKITFEYPETTIVNTYDFDQKPITKEFYIVDGIRIAEIRIGTETRGKMIEKYIAFNATGFGGKHKVPIRKLYNGKEIIPGLEIKRTINSKANENGLSPQVQEMIDIANKAIEANGGDKGYNWNMHAIEDYIYENYTTENGCYYTCIDGAAVLGTYSESVGVYGFYSYGSQGPGRPHYPHHVAFHLENNPTRYYQANGKS